MVRLDIGTLACCAAILSLACATLIAWCGGGRRNWLFALATASQGGGLLLLLAPASPPAQFGGEALLLLSALAAQIGTCRLAGQAWPLLPLALAGLIAAGALVGLDGPAARIALTTLPQLPLLGHAALILARRSRRTAAPGLPLLAASLALWAAEPALGGGVVAFVPGAGDSLLALGGPQGLSLILSALCPLLMTVALVRHDAAPAAANPASAATGPDRAERDLVLLRDALIDALPEPVFAKDRDGRFLAINQAFEQTFNRNRTEVLGRTIATLTDAELAHRHQAADRIALESDQPCCYEMTLPYTDGHPHRVLIHKQRFRDSTGRIAGLVGAVRDLSELSRVSEDLRRSEADQRAILDNMIDLFYRTDAEGRLLMVSRSAHSILLYPAEELLGRSTTMVTIEPDLRARIIAAMRERGGSVTDFEFQVRRKDGVAVWVSASTRLRQDAEGNFLGSEGTLRLIEDRKRAEANLRDSQTLIQALVNCSADATLLLDQDGRLLAGNTVLAERLGRPVETMIGQDLWALFPAEVAAWRREAVRGVIESGRPGRILDRRNGRVFDNSIHPIPDAEGRITRVAVFSRDITDQTETLTRLERSIAEAQRSNAELEQFAYVASHDLREPLRMISTYLSLIERRYAEHFDQDGRQFLTFAREGAQRMDRLVLDLLDYARIGRHADMLEPVPLQVALQQARQVLAPALAQAGATLSVEFSESEPMVRADPGQIARLLQNLIGNALKYRAPDRPPQICISAQRFDDLWRIAVADNGIGIDSDYFEQIFRIFQRLHPQDRYEGTGIGLAICKRIVEQHGGRIWVTSTPGVGSVFSFTLPAAGG